MLVSELCCGFTRLPARTKLCLRARRVSRGGTEPDSPLLTVPRLSLSPLPSDAPSLDVTPGHAWTSSSRAALRSNSEIQDVHLYPPASLGVLSQHKHTYSYLGRMPSCAPLSI